MPELWWLRIRCSSKQPASAREGSPPSTHINCWASSINVKLCDVIKGGLTNCSVFNRSQVNFPTRLLFDARCRETKETESEEEENNLGRESEKSMRISEMENGMIEIKLNFSFAMILTFAKSLSLWKKRCSFVKINRFLHIFNPSLSLSLCLSLSGGVGWW